MNNKIDITFILPVYNTAHYLSECLDSILFQPVNKEIIVIDDGSTDESLSIILDYQHKHKEIFLLRQHNEGLSSSRNKALKIAKGEYISFIDSDDYLIGDIAPVLELGETYQADIIRFGALWRYGDSESARYAQIPFLFSNTKEDTASLLSGYEALFDIEKKGYWIPGLWCSLIKRSYLEAYQLHFKEGVLAEDQLFYIQLLSSSETCKIIEIPSNHYIYRKRGKGAITERKDKQYVIDHFRMVSFILDYMNTLPTSIHSPIFFIIERLLETAYFIVNKWDENEKSAFAQVFQKEWRQLLEGRNSYYWNAFLTLFNQDKLK